MKKLFTLTLVIFLASFCKAQYVTIPDPGFRNILMNMYPSCFNAANEMDTTCTLIIMEDSLVIDNANSMGLLREIRYFDNLKYLSCVGGNLGATILPSNLLYLNAAEGLKPQALSPVLRYADLSFTANGEEALRQDYFPNSLEYLNLQNYDAVGTMLSPGALIVPTTGQMVWPSSLKYLNVAYNSINDLGELPLTLDTLIVKGQRIENQMYSVVEPVLFNLPTLPPGLKYLDCSNNAINGVDFPPSLTWLDCSQNYRLLVSQFGYATWNLPSWSSLGTVLPPTLEYLNCRENSITSLPPLPPALKYLDCSENSYEITTDIGVFENEGISDIGPIPSQLTVLNASANPLLDSLYNLPVTLRYLSIYKTNIRELPELPISLSFLDVSATTIRCIPKLPESMGTPPLYSFTQINLVVNNTVNCLPNFVPGIIVGARDPGYFPAMFPVQNFPVCTVLNNSRGCIFSPVATGHIFHDNNNNGVHDAGELPRQGVKVSIDRGETGFTDLDGKYALACSEGTNVLTITPPVFYDPIPSTINYTLNSGDTLIYDEIALQANTTADSIRVSIVPLNTPRPGFDYGYHVKYENVGTTTLNSTLSITYPDNLLTYLNSSNTSVVQSGNTLSLAAGSLSPGNRGDFTINFNLLATTPLGTILSTEATISSAGIVGTDIVVDFVQGSFDPNDKNATAELSPEDVSSGKFIDYLVRFQNTGTDTAFRVYITDTLSNLLNYESFEMIESSHTCKTLIDSIYVSFEFDNILLPDSNVNERESHGYVRFRIKPKTSLAIGDEVKNKAFIYFDFNVPVETNNAVTKVVAPEPVFQLVDFSGSLQPDNLVRLQWSTNNEQQTSRFIIYESRDGVNRYPVDTVSAIGGATQNYLITLAIGEGTTHYWLKTENINGSSFYSGRISFTVNALPGTSPGSTAIQVRNNPVKGTLVLDVNDPALTGTSGVMINSEGRIVKRFRINETPFTLHVADLSAGVYYIKTSGGTQQVMIMR